jgi:drug/metabolite transporter (DMT)-like permease
VITYVNPAIAVALGVIVLGEPLTLAIIGGFVLIMAGSWLSTRPPANAAERQRVGSPRATQRR